MSKELSEMTIEELWELFPIFLVEPDERWSEYYDEIKAELSEILKGYSVRRISHIGSTAIQGIWAKNIVDVLIEISANESISDVAHQIEQSGFIIMCSDDERISLNKGYTKEGFAEKVYHIHLRFWGDNDELYFRDYLNEHPGIAKEYEKMKLDLWKEYEHDRDGYTNAKTAFIRKWTEAARREYTDRYSLN
ncbi:MAG: GrpB family protein [Parasporobacterium sp.]|nr:GrpB family protein [Parasporobacterium sp.]